MSDLPIPRVISQTLIPFIFVFALYVQFHGDYGPGGGFQAGVIFTAGCILHGLVFGLAALRAAIPPAVVRALAALGLTIYAGCGAAAMAFGRAYLDYAYLAADPAHGRHYGILIVEFGVGVTVAATMLAVFYAFAGRREAAEPH